MIKILSAALLIISIHSQSKPTFAEGLLDISKYVSELTANENGDLKYSLSQIDSIYLYAVKCFNNDKSEAMFCLSFALLPYKSLPIKTPFTHIGLSIYLPSPADSVFKSRSLKLPKNLFLDSPKTVFGDKDKLSHFFGNAFLSYNISFFNISKFMGMFVELFENTFKIDGKVDLRDINTNLIGALFGNISRSNENILPSMVLKMYSFFYVSSLINYK